MKITPYLSLSFVVVLVSATTFASGPRPQNDTAKAARALSLSTRVQPQTHAGLAWGDFDGDSRMDAFAVDGHGQGQLLWNTGDGALSAEGERFGLSQVPKLIHASWQDFDADGWVDLFLLTADAKVMLLKNNAGMLFEDVTLLAGVEMQGVRDAYWIDFDGEGVASLPDLVLTSDQGTYVHRNLGDGTFEEISVPFASLPQRVLPLAVAESIALSGKAELADVPDQLPNAQPNEEGGTRRAVASVGNKETLKSKASASAIGVQPSPPTGAAQPLVSGTFPCANTLEDQDTGNCIEASSIPQIGSLYPQSQSLNVNAATGFVGIQTTNPSALLEVKGGGLGTGTVLKASSKLDEIAGSFSANGTTVPVLQVTSTSRAAEFVGSVDFAVAGIGGVAVTRSRIDTDANDAARAELLNSTGATSISMLAQEFAGDGAQLEMFNISGISTVRIDADDNTEAGIISLDQGDGQSKLQLRATDASSPGAELEMWSTAGNRTVHLVSEEGASNGAQLNLATASGQTTFQIDAEIGSLASELSMLSTSGVETIEMKSEETAGTGSQIILRKGDGSAGIVLDAEQGSDSRITTDTLQITGGADLVESFSVTGEQAKPGSVMVIDAQHPGQLKLSNGAYDKKVVGIVSGAGGVRAGLALGQANLLDGDTPVALAGRVYVRCSTQNGAIEPGDMLTSSALSGHAMRASDPGLSFGSVIGKALTPLEASGKDSTGLVLVLVSLQ